MILDTHLHLVDRTRLSYPWLEGAGALERDWPLEDYASEARRLGIDGALHMEVDVAEEDIAAETGMIAELMEPPGSLLRGAIASGRPEAEGFEDYLAGLDRNVVRGLRRVLHVVDDDVSTTDQFRRNIALLGEAGLPFDICVAARQLHLAADLAAAVPGTTFVLDHCGVPDIAGGAFDSWAEAIRDVAARPNVNAKVSGIVAYTGGDWTVETLRPWFDHLVSCFGYERLCWGSDSPVCTLGGTLSQWVGATHALAERATPAEKDALLQGNARRIWGLD